MIGAMIAKHKVSSAFNALNNRDFQTFLSAWRDDCVFNYPGKVPMSGTHEGIDAIQKWFQKFLDQFPTIEFTVQNLCVDNIFDFVGTNTVAAHWDLKLIKQDNTELRNSGVTVIKIKFGKAEMVTDYFFDTHDKLKIAWDIV